MTIVFTLFPVVAVITGYICAKFLYVIFQKKWISVVAVLLSVTCPFSLSLTEYCGKYSEILNIISYIGYFYLGFIVYFFILGSIIFGIHKIINIPNYRQWLLIGFIGVQVILVLGYFNAICPSIKKITIPAKVNARFCFVSDIHVGSISTVFLMSRLVKLVEKINPDFIVIGGDTIDVKTRENYGKEFLKKFSYLSSKYKTYAIIGNHEIYAGVFSSIKLLQEANIKVLVDSSIQEKGITLIGRLDKTVFDRKPLSEIIPQDAQNVVVIDHNPSNIKESQDNHVLLHLSGHTHGGQFFPMNIITYLLYGPTGELQHFSDTYSYITYGFGFWGPPYRIGTRSEVVVVELKKVY